MQDSIKKAVAAATVRFTDRGGQGVLVPGGLILTAAHVVNWTHTGTMALGHEPQTLPVHAGGGGDTRLQPNPLYVELQPAAPVKPARPAPTPKKKTIAAPAAPRAQTQAAAPPSSNGAYPGASQGFPWPAAPQ